MKLFIVLMLICFSIQASNKGYQTQTLVEEDCLEKAHKAATTSKLSLGDKKLLTFVKYNSKITTVFVKGTSRAIVKKSGKIIRVKYSRSCKIDKSLVLYTKYQLEKFGRLGSIH